MKEMLDTALQQVRILSHNDSWIVAIRVVAILSYDARICEHSYSVCVVWFIFENHDSHVSNQVPLESQFVLVARQLMRHSNKWTYSHM